MKKLIALTLALLLCLTALAGCGGGSGGSGGGSGDTRIAGICMPTKEQTTWTNQGERLAEVFQEAGFQTIVEYAEDDSSKQVMQIENMITKGVDVLVIAAVDCAALTDACEKAKADGIIVIADDRLITNTDAVDYYVTFDLIRMGEYQGQYIADSLDLEHADGPFTLEIFSGSQDDTNAPAFYNGAMNILQPYIDSGKLQIKSGQTSYTETAIQAWDTSKAQARMDNLLSGYYADSHLDAVLVAADCLSIGVISSLESMGYGADGQPFPVVTGQDAELAAVKNVLAGKQSMTIFLDANKVADLVVPLAVSLLDGEQVSADTTYDNGVVEVPTKTYDPYMIDKDNVDYLVEVGFYTDAEING